MSVIALPQNIQISDIKNLDQLFHHLKDQSKRITIDGTAVTAVNAVGIAMLLSWRKVGRQERVALVFNVSDYLYDFIDYLNIVKVLGIKKRK
ncbi:MAG: STAS domain-containing protein [Candidatus Comchoanobacterales bacterium]